MELIKDKWTKLDVNEFQQYLRSFARPHKVYFERKIVNTGLELLGVATPTLQNIAKQIGKGNFKDFLNLNITDTYENMVINGLLICKLTDLSDVERRLYEYGVNIDSWGLTDVLKFKITDKNATHYLKMAENFVFDSHTFVRRLGVIVCLKALNINTIDEILKIVDKLKNDKEYYVNMAVSWLLCDAFIKCRDTTLNFLNTHKLNKFVANKFVSKCRDSFRVSDIDKEMLLKFRQK